MTISQNELRHMAAIGAQHLLSLHRAHLPVEQVQRVEIIPPKHKRHISPEGRARIAAATKKRWARWRKARMVA